MRRYQLKGCKDLKSEVQEMISLLHLEDKTDRQARTLSGGMKRKLCVGIALIGGSSVSGCDVGQSLRQCVTSVSRCVSVCDVSQSLCQCA